MKIFMFLYIACFTIACKNISDYNEEEMIQLCLDKLQQNKDFKYLEQSDLMIVKNNYTINTNKLHFGKKQIPLIDVVPKDIKPYGSYQDVIDNNNKRFIIIKSMLINDKTGTIVIKLPNINQTINFNLVKKGWLWQAKIGQVWFS